MKRLYAHVTDAGTFYICRVAGRYLTMFKSRLLDSYATAEHAARQLAVSQRLSLPQGFTFDELRIRAELREWEDIEQIKGKLTYS